MKKKILGLMVCLAMITSIFAGCGSDSTGSTSSNSVSEGTATDTIKIGVISTTTGGNALLGESAQNAIDMAVEEINAKDGIHIEIVNRGNVMDDAGDSKEAINVYNSLMTEEPDAILGAYFSSVTLAFAELAAGDNMLVLGCGPTNENVTLVGDTIFRNCFTDPYQGKMCANYAENLGAKKVAVVYAKDDDYSNGLKNSFIENLEGKGIEVVYIGECTLSDTDFSAQASQIVASGADLVFYPAFYDTVPLFVQQVRDAGYEGTILGGDGWDATDTTGLETYFDNCYYMNHYSSEDSSEEVQNFVAKYSEKYGTESLTAVASLYYDGIYMILQAAEEGGGTDTASLVEGMTGMTFTGVGGTFTLDENGDPNKSIVINTFENGEIKWVDTLEPDE